MHKVVENFLNSIAPVTTEGTAVAVNTDNETSAELPDAEPARFAPNRKMRRDAQKFQNKHRIDGAKKQRLGGFGATLRGYFDQKRLVAKLAAQAAAQQAVTA